MSPIIPKVNGLLIKSAMLTSLETEVLCLSTDHVTLSSSSEYFFNITHEFDFLNAINLILSFVWIYIFCYFGFYKSIFQQFKVIFDYMAEQLSKSASCFTGLLLLN